jgi:hypothetical protein
MRRKPSRAFSRSPFSKTILIAVGFSMIYLILLTISGGIRQNTTQIGQDVYLGLIFLLGGFLFFSQFVLPNRTILERVQAFYRLLLYPIGKHGQAIFIENGEIMERKGEVARRGPGVILLDTASAALLRTPVRFTRAVGPGIAFIAEDEYVGGTIDLHIQEQTIGPLDDDDPFAPQKEGEDLAVYENRQRRRSETQAFTRDGIEVVPRITVQFKLESTPGEGFTEFGYRAESVERVIIGRPINASAIPESPERISEWKKLPAYLAADVWRECLASFTLLELFESKPNEPNGFEIIQKIIRLRLQKPFSVSLDQYGKLTDTDFKSAEYDIIKKRGLDVLNISISTPHIPDAVEEKIIAQWKSSWLINARIEKELVDNRRSYVSEEGKRKALETYVLGVSNFLGSQADRENISGREILRDLVRGSQYVYEVNPDLHPLITDETEQLRELMTWVEKNNE